MEIKAKFIEAARMYYILESIANKSLKSYALGYRIAENMDTLRKAGEDFRDAFRKEVQNKYKDKQDIPQSDLMLLEFEFSNKWGQEEETFTLRELDFSGEDGVLSVGEIRILMPILKKPE